MNGVIVVFKEQGFTSHDVVAKLRGILKIKKIGHTGTLDPDATGVLPICIGKATKLCDMITDWDKTYEAVMTLGVTTDTLDMTGNIVSESAVHVTEREIVEVCNSFVGEYDQVPPMYSALKVNGRKLYELARAGKEVERKPRRVNIKTLRINDIDLDSDEKTVTITVDCSKGTYIRSLCDDIGRKLGCGAAMKKLIRTRVGGFNIDDTFTLNQLAALNIKGEVKNCLIPVDSIFDNCPRITVMPEYDIVIHNGNAFDSDMVDLNKSDIKADAIRCRVYDSMEHFVGMYSFDNGDYRLIKMFYDNEDK